MHARLDRGAVRLLTRTGLDWTHKYPAIAAAVSSLAARQAYLDGELCGVGPDGITSFSMIQLASDAGNAAGSCSFCSIYSIWMVKTSLRCHSLSGATCRVAGECKLTPAVHHHQAGHGRAIFETACALSVEGIVSKRIDAPYAPGNRGLWRKLKCLHREEFVVVG